MDPLIRVGLLGGLICAVGAAYLWRRKNPLWKQFAVVLLACIAATIAGVFTAPVLESLRTPPLAPDTFKAELIAYEVQSVNSPSERELRAWRSGLLCTLTYNVLVKINNPSEAQFARIARDILDNDAKPRRNWNFVYFYLRTPEGLKSGVPYMVGVYASGGKEENSKKIPPGEYGPQYRFIVRVV